MLDNALLSILILPSGETHASAMKLSFGGHLLMLSKPATNALKHTSRQPPTTKTTTMLFIIVTEAFVLA